jgi:hypothetical protein
MKEIRIALPQEGQDTKLAHVMAKIDFFVEPQSQFGDTVRAIAESW